MTKPTDEELDGFIEGYLVDGEDWCYYEKETLRELARALFEYFSDKEPDDELIENVLKWTDKVLDGVDLNKELPDD